MNTFAPPFAVNNFELAGLLVIAILDAQLTLFQSS
jgi:hypothetical protein